MEKIKEMIEDLIGDLPVELDESTELRGELGLNSMDMITLAQWLESEYGIELPDKELASIVTVGDILKKIA